MNSMKLALMLDHRIIMYLIVKEKFTKDFAELLKVRATEKFFNMVHDQVMTYALEGKAPPAQIATAVMNLADDMMAGRDPVIRAGDYIAFMEFGRTNKMV